MKKVLLSLAIVAVAFSASAQKEKQESKALKLSVGVEAGLPIGDAGDVYSFVIGGSAQGEYAIDKSIGLTLSAGYLNWSGKTVSGFKVPSTGLIPVLVGAKYYFTPKVYGHAQLGMSFASGNGASGSAFTYAPSVGYNITDQIDVAVKYQAASKDGFTTSFIGIRAAYNF